jgi:NAD(P)-dependent dehydrogenase (short-subunit alcohol dehydrogenase family)
MKLAGKVAVVTGVTSEIGKAIALRLASVEDCAAAVAHLASPDMDYVTGQILYVDGGFLCAGVIAR